MKAQLENILPDANASLHAFRTEAERFSSGFHFHPLTLPARTLAPASVLYQIQHSKAFPFPRKGQFRFHGIPFVCKGEKVLILKSTGDRAEGRKRINIRSNIRANSLYLLHGAAYVDKPAQVGTCRIHYADGDALDIPIRALPVRDTEVGEAEYLKAQVKDWWLMQAPLRNDHTLPVRLFEVRSRLNHMGFLYLHRWVNPRPHTPLSVVELLAQLGNAGLWLPFAITLGCDSSLA